MSNDERLRQAVKAHQAGDLVQAEALYRAVLAEHDRHAEASHLLGVLLAQRKNYTEAEQWLHHALQAGGPQPNYLKNLGIALQEQGKLDAAMECYRSALQVAPRRADLHLDAGGVQYARQQYTEAEQHFRRAMELGADAVDAAYKLGLCLLALQRPAEAISWFEHVVQRRPDHYEAANNLAVIHTASGRIRRAVQIYRQALQNPSTPVSVHSNLLMDMHYSVHFPPAEIQAEQARFVSRWPAPPVRSRPQSGTARAADRRLRVGYVSPDFKSHSVSYFIEPILERHDRSAIKVYCYHTHPQEDEVSRRIRSLDLGWRDAANWDDDNFAARIAQDEIDILVDLAGHTRYNRILVFRHRPAPVQISYLGYPDSTGLPEIPNRLTDRIADPPVAGAPPERLLYLSPSYFCYRPPLSGALVPSSARPKREEVTFGSFNNHAKLSRAILDVWIKLLRAMPEAKLLLKNRALTDETTRRELSDYFAASGISPARLQLVSYAAGIEQHLLVYQQVDIALDSFPYSGATTTCEALWMSVPVITLAGYQHAGRMSASILNAVGLNEFVTDTSQQYVEAALRLASQRERLSELHSTLRQRLLASPLCDEITFTRALEATYRQVWQDHFRNAAASK